jgi:hypothetical protein
MLPIMLLLLLLLPLTPTLAFVHLSRRPPFLHHLV